MVLCQHHTKYIGAFTISLSHVLYTSPSCTGPSFTTVSIQYYPSPIQKLATALWGDLTCQFLDQKLLNVFLTLNKQIFIIVFRFQLKRKPKMDIHNR